MQWGFLFSVLYLAVWVFVGGAWWKAIGAWHFGNWLKDAICLACHACSCSYPPDIVMLMACAAP